MCELSLRWLICVVVVVVVVCSVLYCTASITYRMEYTVVLHQQLHLNFKEIQTHLRVCKSSSSYNETRS